MRHGLEIICQALEIREGLHQVGACYRSSLAVEVPRVQTRLSAMIDSNLNLSQGDTCSGMVDVAVVFGKIECCDDGGAEVVVVGE